MLRDCNQRWLVICGRVDCGHSIDTSGKPFRHIRGQLAINCIVVKALEEGEFGRIGHPSRGERSDLLNNDMRVSNNVPIFI